MPTRVQNFFSAMLGALVVAVAFGALALGGAFDTAQDGDTATTEQESSASSAAAPSSTPVRNATDVSELYERVKDSVAYISVRSGSGAGPFGRQQAGSGSGFVLDDDGHIVTNQHVVDNASQVKVRLGEGDDLMDAKVVGTDASTDLAVIKVDPKDVKGGIKPLALGEADALRVGQPTIAIGSPFGLSGTLTTGVVSALDRTIDSPNSFTIDGVVQTDAAINPGNSGGPLLNGKGEVIGVNAQIASGGSASNSGVGFAIPVDIVKDVVPQLKAGKEIRRSYLGISTGPSQDGTKVVIAEIVSGGPSSSAGLRVGDEVVSVGGKPVAEPEDIAAAIADKKPGQTVRIVVTRDGERRTITVKLGTRPESAQRQGG